MMLERIAISLLVLMGGAAVRAEPVTEVENAAYWMCKAGRRVRTIRVHVDESGLCSTFYSKDGLEKAVGSGKNRESCLNILTNIKNNLEKSAKWSCRDISSSRMSASVGS